MSQKSECPCPVACQDKMKQLYKYIKDTQVFLKACDKCPIAKGMIELGETLLKDFECARSSQKDCPFINTATNKELNNYESASTICGKGL